MNNQELFNQISKIDFSSFKDESIKKVFILMLNLIENLQQENQQLKDANQALRDEINRLKGEQGKPNIKSNTQSKGKNISTGGKERKAKRHQKKAKKAHIEVHQTIKIPLDKCQLPQDAKFKYWDDVITQDIVFQVKNTRYQLAVYYSPSLGKTYRAKVPQGASYHSKNLQSFIITLNKVLDVTESKILALLNSIDVEISKGSISAILLKYTAIAEQEKQKILKAGLANSYVQTDITGVRVCGKNNYSNIITHPFFTCYTTSSGKSHLDVLAAFQGLDTKNNLRLRYDALSIQKLKEAKISKSDLDQLAQILKDQQILTLLDFESLIKEKIPNLYHKKNIFIKVKSALASAYYQHQNQIPKVTCLVSDHAPEYNNISTQNQSLCWVHDARYYKKLDPKLEIHREKLDRFIGLYWEYYHQLLAYKKAPNKELASKLENDFDNLFTTKTDYFQLDKLIEKTFKNKKKLLTVLQRPEIPLHNNLAELGARRKVRKRDISYHTMSEKGTRCLDAFMTITQTAMQLNVDVFKYIKQMINQDKDRVTLDELILQKY